MTDNNRTDQTTDTTETTESTETTQQPIYQPPVGDPSGETKSNPPLKPDDTGGTPKSI